MHSREPVQRFDCTYGGSRFANRSDFEARLHAAAYGALLLRESVGDDHGALLT